MVLLLLVVVVHDLVVGIDHVVLLLRASRLAAGRLFGAPAPAPPAPPPPAPRAAPRRVPRCAPGGVPLLPPLPCPGALAGGSCAARPLRAFPRLVEPWPG